MASRIDLQSKLEELLGSTNVYYQPPETLKMQYDCIRYSKSRIEGRFANDAAYSLLTRYEIIVIARKPDNEVIMDLLQLPYCSYERHYQADNLHHDVLTLYW